MIEWIKRLLPKKEKKKHYTFDDADRVMATHMRSLNRQLMRKQKLMELREMKRALDDMERDEDEYYSEEEEEEPQDDFAKFMEMVGATVAAGPQQPAENGVANEGWPVDPRFPPANVVQQTLSPPAPTPNPLFITALEKQLPDEAKKYLANMSEEEVAALGRALHKQLKGTK